MSELTEQQGENEMVSVFFGYPERVPQAESMRLTASGIHQQDKSIRTVTWEDLAVDGNFIMRTVLSAIDDADVAVFDLTVLNPNVLFEVGYAIARAKHVRLTMDTTTSTYHQSWRDLALLSAVAYTGYRNSDELVANWFVSDPLDDTTIYDTILEPGFSENATRTQLLYCKSPQPFEASIALTKLIDKRANGGLIVTKTDPEETQLELLTWYLPRIYTASGIILHFAGATRSRADVFNARNALIAGLCVGLEKATLMLAEKDYTRPFDYQDMLVTAPSAAECLRKTKDWFATVVFTKSEWQPRRQADSGLRSIYFGEHVAENERRDLHEYFVPTAAYHQVVANRDAIFIGQRGTGKTANVLQAVAEIASSRDNLSVLIKPQGFEFPILTNILSRLPEYQFDHFFDTFWQFVIQTEIAATALADIRSRPTIPLTRAETKFVAYIDSAPFKVTGELTERLEQALNDISKSLPKDRTGQDQRNLVNEALHTKSLPELRKQLGMLLTTRKRVAVFVDNLDKGWQRGADFVTLARLILGLMTARGQVTLDFSRSDNRRLPVNVTVSVFLRTDIWSYVKREAREPDKLPISEVVWKDQETLLGVLETRFEAKIATNKGPEELWTKYFRNSLEGTAARDYIPMVILPRPRDAIVFCNAAVSRAIDRGHREVEEDDLRATTETYSQYAYNALLVENGFTTEQMEDGLLGFLGVRAVLTSAEVRDLLIEGGLADEKTDEMIAKLINSYFLGIEEAEDTFVFPDSDASLKRAERKAARLQPEPSLRRFVVHQAFRSFLEITS